MRRGRMGLQWQRARTAPALLLQADLWAAIVRLS